MAEESNDKKKASPGSLTGDGIIGGVKKAGLPPDALVFVGKAGDFKPELEAIVYNSERAEQFNPKSVDEARKIADHEGVSWVTLFGVHDADLVGEMGNAFNIHSLLLEDILDTTQRPTSEVFEDSLFFSLKMLKWEEDKKHIRFEQVSVVLAEHVVLLFQEQPGDIFDGIRQRILTGKGVIRSKGADFLVYRLIDTVVDQYFITAEHIAQRIEKLEMEIMREPNAMHMTRLLKIKKQLLRLRRSIVPLRDNVSLLERSQHRFIHRSTLPYIRDVGDHIKEVIEMLDMYRETVTSLIDLYMTSTNNQMSQVMKVLTVITSIFIPLSFIAGVYGMNFEYMPELQQKYGYFWLWGVMALITIAMLLFFRRKKWL